jgi:hypothetical protein
VGGLKTDSLTETLSKLKALPGDALLRMSYSNLLFISFTRCIRRVGYCMAGVITSVDKVSWKIKNGQSVCPGDEMLTTFYGSSL